MSNAVDHPSYYNKGKIQVIDFIADQNLDFCLGNVIKYICRAGLKCDDYNSILEKELEDLKKARFYLDYEIKQIESLCNLDSDSII